MNVPMHTHELTFPRSLFSSVSVSSGVAQHFGSYLASDYVSSSLGQTFRRGFAILEVKVVGFLNRELTSVLTSPDAFCPTSHLNVKLEIIAVSGC
jgi:hypothetical protein